MSQQVVAKRPDGALLIQTTNDSGFIYQPGEEVRGIDRNIHSIIAKGYWEEYQQQLSDERLQEILSLSVQEK